MFIINKHKQLVLLEKEFSKQVLKEKKNTNIGRELWEHEQAKNTSPFFSTNYSLMRFKLDSVSEFGYQGILFQVNLC